MRLTFDFGTMPRPLRISESGLDRQASDCPQLVRQQSESLLADPALPSAGVHDAADKLAVKDPWDYNRLPTWAEDDIIE
jgi:hypothetical protein